MRVEPLRFPPLYGEPPDGRGYEATLPTFGHPRWHALFRHFAHKWAPRWHELCSHVDFLPSLGTPELKMTITDLSPKCYTSVVCSTSRHFSFRAKVRLAWYCCPRVCVSGCPTEFGRMADRVSANRIRSDGRLVFGCPSEFGRTVNRISSHLNEFGGTADGVSGCPSEFGRTADWVSGGPTEFG